MPHASDAPFAGDPAGRASTPIGSTAGEWAVAMADFALELHGSFPDFDATIAAIAASAVKILPGVTAAGVGRISKDGVLTCLTATNPQVLQMMQAEHQAGRGPLLQALDPANSAKVLVDAADAERWPHYAEEAVAIGVAAVLAVRLDDAAGAGAQALLLVTDTGFGPGVVEVVEVFAGTPLSPPPRPACTPSSSARCRPGT